LYIIVGPSGLLWRGTTLCEGNRKPQLGVEAPRKRKNTVVTERVGGGGPILVMGGA